MKYFKSFGHSKMETGRRTGAHYGADKIGR